MKPLIARPLLPLAAICVLLTACGGGGDTQDAVPASPSGPVSTTPTTPTTPTAYAPDLKSFATAWTSLQIAETAFDILHISGESGNCGAGGTTAYDLGAVRQTLTQCVTRTSPDAAYTGGWSAGVSVGGSQKTVTMSSPTLTVTDPTAAANPALSITAGNVNGVDDFSNDTLDAYSGVGFSLDARVGASASTYHIGSNTGATASQSVQNGVATLLVASAAIGVNVAGGAWTFTVQNLRSVGDARPDQGTLVVADSSQASTAATTVTFGPGNSLQFASGGQSLTKNWADADVVAALALAKQ